MRGTNRRTLDALEKSQASPLTLEDCLEFPSDLSPSLWVTIPRIRNAGVDLGFGDVGKAMLRLYSARMMIKVIIAEISLKTSLLAERLAELQRPQTDLRDQPA